MLVLSRRVNETVLIGDDVEVEILDVCGGQVKLGIRAPRAIPVLRSELLATIQQNQVAAEMASNITLGKVLSALRENA